MTTMSCEAFQRAWKELVEKTKENSNHELEAEALMHLENCESCRKWCDKLFAEQVAALPSELFRDILDVLNVSVESDGPTESDVGGHISPDRGKVG